MLFTEELRKCLDAAGLSDCGENDAWNYWYQRVLKAHNEAVERQIATEQVENAKLRELCERAYIELQFNGNVTDAATEQLIEDMRELGVDA